MCLDCGCGEQTALVCPECGGRVILIDEKPKCLSCGATPSLEEASAAHEHHHHHHTKHAHAHDEETSGERDDLETKLGVLLPHWIEHNAEHAESFHTWAERARAVGAEHLTDHIEEAICKIEAANRDLEGAIEHVGAAVSEHVHLDHDHPHS